MGVDRLSFWGDSRFELNESRPSMDKNEGLGVPSEVTIFRRENLD